MPWLNLLSLIGIFGLCGMAWLTSENRRVISWKTLMGGLVLQWLLGAFVFLVPVTRQLMILVNDAVNAILDAAEAGSRFVFGSVLVPNPTQVPGPMLAGRWIARTITPPYAPVPGDYLTPENFNLGYIFAFRALPGVVFFSALMALLYALGIMQPIVNLFARLFRRSMNLSGAESLSGAANIFVGIEALLVVRPYLARMTRSELCAILASCFGSIASGVLALYSSLLRPVFPNITGHLVAASIMSIPACFVMAKLIVPETEIPVTFGQLVQEINVTHAAAKAAQPVSQEIAAEQLEADSTAETTIAEPTDRPPMALSDSGEAVVEESIGLMESVIVGALDGVRLAVAIAAVLIAVLGLLALVNLFFANLGSLANSKVVLIQWVGRFFQAISLQNLAGAVMLPLTFLTGVSVKWSELWQASLLLGERLLATEVPSYQQLASLSSQGLISDRTLVVTSYALCGFAHLPSLGIFVGGLVGLIPSRRRDIVALSWKALWAATLATLMIGGIAGLFYGGSPSIIGR